MDILAHWFQAVEPFVGQYRYALLAGVTILEGTWSVLVVGVLAAAGVMNPWWTFIACLVGR